LIIAKNNGQTKKASKKKGKENPSQKKDQKWGFCVLLKKRKPCSILKTEEIN